MVLNYPLTTKEKQQPGGYRRSRARVLNHTGHDARQRPVPPEVTRQVFWPEMHNLSLVTRHRRTQVRDALQH